MAWAVGAAVLWGVVPLMVERAVRETDPVFVNAWRNLGAAALLIPACAAGPGLAVRPDVLAVIAASGILGQGVGALAYTEALSVEGPERVIPISFTYVLWTQVAGGMAFGEPYGLATLAGAAAALVGVWAVAGGGSRGSRGSLRGAALAGLSSVAWTGGTILSRQALFGAPALTVAAWRAAMFAAAFSAVQLTRGRGLRAPAAPTGYSLASGVLGLGVGMALYFRAMSEVGAGAAALAAALTPVISQVSSRASSGEGFEARVWLGGALVALGVAAAALDPARA